MPSSRSCAKLSSSCPAGTRRTVGLLQVGQRAAVHFLRQFLRIGIDRVGVVPGQVQDRIGEGAALLAIHLPHPVEDPGHDIEVALSLARRFGRLPVPLQPTRGVHQRAVFLGEARRRKLEHLGLDAGRVGRVLRPEILPEMRGLGVQRVHHDQELQLAQPGADLAAVGEGLLRIEALADVAVHLAVVHHLERPQHVVHRHVELGQPVIGPVVVGARRVAVDRLLEADEELVVVLPVARLVGPQRLVRVRLGVVVERHMACRAAWPGSRASAPTSARRRSGPGCSSDRAGRSCRRRPRRCSPAATGPSPWCGCSANRSNAASSRVRTGWSSPCPAGRSRRSGRRLPGTCPAACRRCATPSPAYSDPHACAAG